MAGNPGNVYKMNSNTPTANGENGVVSEDTKSSNKTEKSWLKPNSEWVSIYILL